LLITLPSIIQMNTCTIHHLDDYIGCTRSPKCLSRSVESPSQSLQLEARPLQAAMRRRCAAVSESRIRVGRGRPTTNRIKHARPSESEAGAGALDASVRGSGPPLCAASGGASDSEAAGRATRAALHLAPRTCASANRPSHRRYQCPGLGPAHRIGLRNQHPPES
jgi:hypothetical protein